MGKIKHLPLEEAYKIAAGEVVDRPSNVIKELIENALDAQAHSISIYVEQAGNHLIRIVDDGCGMSREDALICFDHHATSKINSVHELSSISSFGFRGEALTSISAVSKITLSTKEHDAETGIQLKRNEGIITDCQEIACASGTDIAVHDLFYNVPARKKFLKSHDTEWRQIVSLFQAFCFSYPAIHFKLYHEQKLMHNCPPVSSLRDRIHQVLPASLSKYMIELHDNEEELNINGVISNSQVNRYDRSLFYFFVNNRWIKNSALSKAVLKGYLNVLQPNRFPAAIISITMNSQDVDINIHPKKEDVQFLHPRKIEQAIANAVKNTLQKNFTLALSNNPAPAFVRSLESVPPITQSSGWEIQPSHTFIPPVIAFKQPMMPEKHVVYSEPLYQEENTNITSLVESHEFSIVGVYRSTYIIIEVQNELLLVDQHAAHERILYEQFKNIFGSVPTIALLFPLILDFNEHELEILINYTETISKHGIILEQMGQNKIIVQSLPIHLKETTIADLLREIVVMITDHQSEDKETFSKIFNEKLHAQMACKGSVKAGDSLSTLQIEELLKNLYQTENRFVCPHGRPTMISFLHSDIERKFKRKQ